MTRDPIGIFDLLTPTFAVWDKTWFLLTAGQLPAPGAPPAGPKPFNAMTISWGGLGFIWGQPLAIVVVRPQRFTFEFMERSPDFSLCAFTEQYREALNVLGVKSGRDSDKLAESGLTPIPLSQIRSPGFAEADLILQCRKTYWQDLDPSHFLADYIEPLYRNDYHRVYFGEVLAAEGTSTWRRP